MSAACIKWHLVFSFLGCIGVVIISGLKINPSISSVAMVLILYIFFHKVVKIKFVNDLFSVCCMYQMASCLLIPWLHWNGHNIWPENQPVNCNCRHGVNVVKLFSLYLAVMNDELQYFYLSHFSVYFVYKP